MGDLPEIFVHAGLGVFGGNEMEADRNPRCDAEAGEKGEEKTRSRGFSFVIDLKRVPADGVLVF